MKSKIWLLYIVLFLMYYLQVSFPYYLSIGDVTPNFMLFFILAVFYVFRLGLLWPLLLIALVLLEMSTELPLGVLSFIISAVVVLQFYLKKVVSDDYLSLAIIPLCLLVYQILIVSAALLLGFLSWFDVWQYSYRIVPLDFLFGLLIVTALIFAIRYFIKTPTPSIQIEA